MPVLNCDPWRVRFYKDNPCPPDLTIALHDPDAYRMFPRHNWVYNKLLLAEKQGLDCGPDGILPTAYPVFCKPIYNLRSMGIGSGRVDSEAALITAPQPGMMWSTLLTGDHYSTDIAVQDGVPVWTCHAQGFPMRGGMFDHWIVRQDAVPALADYLEAFVRAHFAGFTGVMNFETIGGRIIEAHLRYAEQWLDLYGPEFLPAVYSLFRGTGWREGAMPERTGYSVALFGETRQYTKPGPEFIADLLTTEGVTGLELPFHEAESPESHSNPPGGFRLSIINGHDLDACRAVRSALADYFAATDACATSGGQVNAKPLTDCLVGGRVQTRV